MKERVIPLIGILILLFMPLTLGLSNESIQAGEALEQAEKDIFEMETAGISINRVNETYQEASQLYLAQKTLEARSGYAKYKIVLQYTDDISEIKNNALKANDELRIFKETIEAAEEEGSNLSAMQEEYDAVITSFDEERFEDTLVLINKGYDRLSEIQSSQTAVNAVYQATSRTLKNFLKKYGTTIIIFLVSALIFLLIFQDSLRRIMIKRRLNHLKAKKKSVNLLMKKMQSNYFKSRKISEAEYTIKMKKFKEIIRDVDRETMALNEKKFRSMRGGIGENTLKRGKITIRNNRGKK